MDTTSFIDADCGVESKDLVAERDFRREERINAWQGARRMNKEKRVRCKDRKTMARVSEERN